MAAKCPGGRKSPESTLGTLGSVLHQARGLRRPGHWTPWCTGTMSSGIGHWPTHSPEKGPGSPAAYPGTCGLDAYLPLGSRAPAGGVEAEWMLCLGALSCLWVSFPLSHSACVSIQMGLVAEQRVLPMAWAHRHQGRVSPASSYPSKAGIWLRFCVTVLILLPHVELRLPGEKLGIQHTSWQRSGHDHVLPQ